MNQFNVIGNLTKNPELTETSNGVKVCRFSVAVKRDYVNSDGERKTDFFDVVAWRGLGENVAKYSKKGNKVRVTGPMETRPYEDSKGVKHMAYEINASVVEFLSARNKRKKSDDDNHNLSSEDSDIPF